jgi:hypothetical protein
VKACIKVVHLRLTSFLEICDMTGDQQVYTTLGMARGGATACWQWHAALVGTIVNHTSPCFC